MGWKGNATHRRYPSYGTLGGPQGRSGQVRKISPLPGLDPRTAQFEASRYTDWAIPALNFSVRYKEFPEDDV